MAIGIGSIISAVVSSLLTSIFAYFVLKLLNQERSYFRIFIVILISDLVIMFLPLISMLGIAIPGIVSLIITIVISFIIIKYGLDLSCLHTIILVILTPIIAFIISFVLAFIGIGALIGISSLF